MNEENTQLPLKEGRCNGVSSINFRCWNCKKHFKSGEHKSKVYITPETFYFVHKGRCIKESIK